VDGLVHVSDISWNKRIKHPGEVLKKGQEIEAVITNIDVDNRRLSLSIKDAEPSAWDKFINEYKPGDIVLGKITRLANFGVFVELVGGVEGLCHVSELSDERVARPEDAVQIGQVLDFRILRIEPESKKVGLSARAAKHEEPNADIRMSPFDTQGTANTKSEPIQFYSCFISYSFIDEEFAKRLYFRLQKEGIRVWFAPEDIKGGKPLGEQIERAIRLYDKVLLILSEESLRSEWVITEIRKTRKIEMEENRRKLFPIRLVDYNAILKWECIDPESGSNMASEVRQYFIPNFSNWKNHEDFELAVSRLLKDLQASEQHV
jgi:predicted RNA-binding protein with RPS1 domain